MFWIIFIALIVIVILGKFFLSLNKDKDDLNGTTLDKKFNIIINMLNDAAFDGNGSVTTLSWRDFNLYEEGSNQIIQFMYSTGSLSITWRYKYFQKEVVHEYTIDNARNLSLFEQQKSAERLINEMIDIINNHKNNVWNF